MIALLKRLASVLILVCFLLPVSQCTDTKISPETNERIVFVPASAEIINPSKVVLYPKESLIVKAAIVLSFIFPIIFCVVEVTHPSNGASRRVIQSLFSAWFLVFLYFLLHGLVRPLPAGWVLLVSGLCFCVVVNLEWRNEKT